MRDLETFNLEDSILSILEKTKTKYNKEKKDTKRTKGTSSYQGQLFWVPEERYQIRLIKKPKKNRKSRPEKKKRETKVFLKSLRDTEKKRGKRDTFKRHRAFPLKILTKAFLRVSSFNTKKRKNKEKKRKQQKTRKDIQKKRPLRRASLLSFQKKRKKRERGFSFQKTRGKKRERNRSNVLRRETTPVVSFKDILSFVDFKEKKKLTFLQSLFLLKPFQKIRLTFCINKTNVSLCTSLFSFQSKTKDTKKEYDETTVFYAQNTKKKRKLREFFQKAQKRKRHKKGVTRKSSIKKISRKSSNVDYKKKKKKKKKDSKKNTSFFFYPSPLSICQTKKQKKRDRREIEKKEKEKNTYKKKTEKSQPIYTNGIQMIKKYPLFYRKNPQGKGFPFFSKMSGYSNIIMKKLFIQLLLNKSDFKTLISTEKEKKKKEENKIIKS